MDINITFYNYQSKKTYWEDKFHVRNSECDIYRTKRVNLRKLKDVKLFVVSFRHNMVLVDESEWNGRFQ